MNKITMKKRGPRVAKESQRKQVLDDVMKENAYEILKKFRDENPKVSKRLEELALEYLTEVDPDDVAEDVFSDLDSLRVEDVWDNSGGTRDGYVDPGELASEMFGEVIEPYLENLRKCQKLARNKEAKLSCMGIMKGIYKFEKEATTEFKDWAVDDPIESFRTVYEEWRKGNTNSRDMADMKVFVENNFPEWSKYVRKK